MYGDRTHPSVGPLETPSESMKSVPFVSTYKDYVYNRGLNWITTYPDLFKSPGTRKHSKSDRYSHERTRVKDGQKGPGEGHGGTETSTTTRREGLRCKSLQYNHQTLVGTTIISVVPLTVCDIQPRKGWGPIRQFVSGLVVTVEGCTN